MDKHFRLQLTIVLIFFSLVISFGIILFDYYKLQDRVRIEHNKKVKVVENTIVNSLHTIDKIYSFHDEKTANKMEKYSKVMQRMYANDPDINNWDFAELKKQFEMDVYVIDADNVVVNSSFTKDVGLDFDDCCVAFAKLLDERRMSNSFYHDGMDIQQVSGQIKKFSYMPTPDQKYLLELGVLLEDDEAFKQFSFLDVIDSLKKEYKAINSINVYSPGGLVLGYTGRGGNAREISDDMRSVFLEVVQSGEAREIVKKKGEKQVTYRYIPYTAEKKRGLSTNRIVEINYNEAGLEGRLSFYRKEFIYQLFIIIAASFGLSFFIARLVAKPIYLAFHDSLTGLRNRAAFENEVEKKLRKRNGSVALMMIDLDNFKLVNDKFGHAEGDRILKSTAKIIEEAAGEKNLAARIGGDEFVVVFSNMQENEISTVATLMIEKIKREYAVLQYQNVVNVSISIGIAFADDGEKIETLYNTADKALYKSKENGENQYTIYRSEND